MAEYVDFHYMPLEGKITGKQVLKQTEDAINDLGQHVYEIDIDNEKIQEAIDTSNQAIETAEEALAVVTTNRAVWYNSVTELREAIIDNGIVAAIKGYAFAGDEGQAFYVVREKKSGDVDDGKTIIFLDAGNVAEIIANTGITNMFDFDEDGYLSQIVDGDISNQYGEKKRLASYEGQQEIVEAFNDVINASLDIKGNAESARNSAEIAKQSSDALIQFLATKETITAPAVDTTLTVSGAAADAKVTGDWFGDISYKYIPTNYGAFDALDLTGGVTTFLANVTATDNAQGGVNVSHTNGTNSNIGFALNDLPYGEEINLKFKVTVTNAKTPINISLRYGMNNSDGTVITWIVQNEMSDGTFEYTWNNFNLYNYSTHGVLYLGYNLRYNQTTPVTISLSVTKVGDISKTIIKDEALKDIGFNNLSETLQDIITGEVVVKPTLYDGKQITTFNKGVCIGDSLTAGVFNHNEGGTMAYLTNSAFSYPAKLAQLTGITVTNLGNGGYTSDQWWTAHSSDDLSGNQFAIVQLGVNDAIQYSEWTNTSETAFTNIINKLLNENNGIFVFVSTIIPATSYRGASYDSVTQGIKDLVEDINNDHVILLDMNLYGNTADEVGYNNGHLSALGYDRLALDYVSYISYVISQNTTLFRNIQFIGTNYSYS